MPASLPLQLPLDLAFWSKCMLNTWIYHKNKELSDGHENWQAAKQGYSLQVGKSQVPLFLDINLHLVARIWKCIFFPLTCLLESAYWIGEVPYWHLHVWSPVLWFQNFSSYPFISGCVSIMKKFNKPKHSKDHANLFWKYTLRYQRWKTSQRRLIKPNLPLYVSCVSHIGRTSLLHPVPPLWVTGSWLPHTK